MKILYVTRHFNHSGYEILNRLIQERIPIDAVLLHRDNNPWRRPIIGAALRVIYSVKCFYYRCEALKTLRSEERLAKRNDIPIIWTDSIKSDSFYQSLIKLQPDIIILGGGWHELIPKRVFDFPRLGCLNTHPSLLPEFRGTSITRWQILNGVCKSGSTIHYVDHTFDTGGVLAQCEVSVSDSTTPQQLFLELGRVGADIMIPLLKKFSNAGKQNTYSVEHNTKYYDYFKKWNWNLDLMRIDWHKSFRDIHFHVLANTQESYEYLGAFFEINDRKYFLRKTSIEPLTLEQKTFVAALTDNNVYIHSTLNGKTYLCKRGDKNCLVLERIQRFDKFYKYRRSHCTTDLTDYFDKKIFVTNE